MTLENLVHYESFNTMKYGLTDYFYYHTLVPSPIDIQYISYFTKVLHCKRLVVAKLYVFYSLQKHNIFTQMAHN